MSVQDEGVTTVSYNQLLVLHALESGCRYGFEIMGFTDLSAGTVYPILRRFEANGWVESSKEDAAEAHANGRPARRMHRLEPAGRESLVRSRETLIARQRDMGLIPPAG